VRRIFLIERNVAVNAICPRVHDCHHLFVA